MIGDICSVDLLFDAWIKEAKDERLSLIRAARRGDRAAFEAIRDGFKAWKSNGIDRLLLPVED